MKTIHLFLITALLALFCTPMLMAAEDGKIRIGVSLPTTRQQRWVRDGEALLALARKNDKLDVFVEVGNNNQMQQNLQITRLLSQDIDVLILAPHDAASAASMVRKAHDQGVKVISYDRLVLGANVDVFITFDNEKVGELQATYLAQKVPSGNYILLSGSPNDNNSRFFKAGAMKILDPLIAAGKITVAVDAPVIDWMPENAKKIIEKALADGVKPDAILSPNDNTASGVIEVLAAHGLAGKIPVSGQDADLDGAKRISQGLQAMTVFKDTRLLAAKSVEVAILMSEKGSWEAMVNSKISDGKNEVRAILLEPVMVDKGNLEDILIKSEYWNYDEVFDK